MHPSAFSSPFQVGSLSLLPDCVTVGSQHVVCSQRRLWEAFCVPGIGETPLQDPFPKCSSFQSCLGQWMAALAEGMGQSRSCGHREKQVVPSCTVQGHQPHPSLLSLDVPELQMDLMLQINLNCK